MRSGKQQTVSRCKYYNGVRERWDNEVEVSEMESIPSAQMRLQKAQERRKGKAVVASESQLEAEARVGLPAQVSYSDIFLKQEETKKRVLHDLKSSGANKGVRTNPVKQDGVKLLKGLIRPGDRFALWDLRKMFFQILVQPRLRRALRTKIWLLEMGRKCLPQEWRVRRLENATLSMGLAVAPEIATKLFADVLRVIRKLGIRAAIKVDDLVAVLPNDPQEALMQAYVVTRLLIKLGAILSANKCDFGMRHRVVWHGMVFCSIVQVCSVTAKKVTKSVQLAGMLARLLQSRDGVLTVRALAKLIGTLISNMEGVDAARIMVVDLQLLRTQLTLDPDWEWDRVVAVRSLPRVRVLEALETCKEWAKGYNPQQAHKIHWNGKFMYSEHPTAVIYTDACEWQRGVWVKSDRHHKEIDRALPFVGEEMKDHITLQETAAAADGVVETMMERNYCDCVLVAKIDATAAVKYIKCMGGRMASFTKRIRTMQQLLRDRHVQLLAGHIAGEINPADAPSRRRLGMMEWKLSFQMYNALRMRWGPFGLDACAASWNAQEPRYISRQRSDTEAITHDVLSYPLQNETLVIYMYPPAHRVMVLELLQRIKSAQVEVVMVLPAWPSQQVIEALRMAVDEPMVMEMEASSLVEPEAYRYHLSSSTSNGQWWSQKKWSTFLGIRLSGVSEKSEAYRRSWRMRSDLRTKKGEMENILTRSTACWLPVSSRSQETTRFVSQTLLSVT